MNNKAVLRNFLVIFVLFVIILAFWGAFTVNQNQVGVVTDNYMGNKPKLRTMGLHWYMPILQNVDYIYINQHTNTVYFGNNLITQDKKPVTISLIVNWKVIQPLLYFDAITEKSNIAIEAILSQEIRNQIESFIASKSLDEINQYTIPTERLNTLLAKYGIKIIGLSVLDLSSKVVGGIVTNTVESQVVVQSINLNPNLSIESAFNEAGRIKTNTLIQEADIYNSIRLQNPKLYNYMREIDVYRQTSKSKSDIPPLDKMYTK